MQCSTMDYAWTMCGLCQDYVWIMRGLSIMLELCVERRLGMVFLIIQYLRIIPSCLDHVWIVLGACTFFEKDNAHSKLADF